MRNHNFGKQVQLQLVGSHWILLTQHEGISVYFENEMLKTFFLNIYSQILNRVARVFKLSFVIKRVIVDIAEARVFKRYIEKLVKKLKWNPIMVGANGVSLLITIQTCSGLEKTVKIQDSGSNLH